MRIDAHQHFWRYQVDDFPWIGKNMACLQQDFLPQNLAPARHACGIDATIAVQARPRLDETDFLLDLAETDASIVGVVGWIDPEADDLEAQLSRWQSPRLCGFRHLIQDEATPSDYLRSKHVQRSVQTLQHREFSYDVLVTAAHLPATYDFCAACDQHTLILDHLGKPNIKGSELDAWRREFMRLGELPHVACKLSGLVTEADWQHWQPHELWPCLDVALEIFGEGRLLFGSDWPVCLVAGSYHDVFALIDDWAGERGLDKRKLFGLNAQHLYGLRAIEPTSEESPT
ncbi:amidohydrolase family protein [Chromohalobacter sarecensis]|uniref:Amidohydrolase family protein n=1 Tax=Chromohalobacter sarecensis TaxID=245294 RepID=A0ABV9D2T8_9GAMM|nr:amidohydrolase family protein [Chromohalobacter sarecensis]MCK0715863.1 amidohydrolase family protein [Chromohalobacter sarecensis]